MKVVILAGGLGTRLSEETDRKPKPMIEIGGRPILWHIMMIYSSFGFHDFIICLGYKGHLIKEYFANYVMNESDVTFDLRNKRLHYRSAYRTPWKVTLVNTGDNAMTGGRLKQIQKYVGNETFLLTYGDGVTNADLKHAVQYHHNHGKLATVTAVQPAGRFGALDIGTGNQIVHFDEKPTGDGGWINGGFFVLEPEIFDYIDGDATIFEKEPLERLVRDEQLLAYRHEGFWYAMDTVKDKQHLEQLWNSGQAPWKLW